MRSLKDNGMSLQRIRRAWGYLSRKGVDPRTVRLESDGVSVFQIEDDEIIDLLRGGQMAFLEVLDEITEKVEDDVTRFELDRKKFQSVVQSTREEVGRRRIESASG